MQVDGYSLDAQKDKLRKYAEFQEFGIAREYSYDITSGINTRKGDDFMDNTVFTIEKIVALVKPLAEKYQVQQIYLFGSYVRGEAGADSDLDFLVYGRENFKLTNIFSLAEDLREVLNKKVDVFEIHEINMDSDFYNTIMKERLLVA